MNKIYLVLIIVDMYRLIPIEMIYINIQQQGSFFSNLELLINTKNMIALAIAKIIAIVIYYPSIIYIIKYKKLNNIIMTSIALKYFKRQLLSYD